MAALIDGELSRGAHHRALDHLAHCEECRTVVHLQRQAKAALVGAGIPAVPGDLLCRLRSVPMTTDLDTTTPGQLAMADGELVWVPAARPEPPNTEPPARRPRTRRTPRPDRPRSYPIHRTRSVRLRRGLAGTLAGLAFGVVSAAAPLGSSGIGLQRPGVVERDPQVVPAGVGFGLNLPPRRPTGSVDRSVRPTPVRTAPTRSVLPATTLVSTIRSATVLAR